ncbi:MAG TPA: patatin-like phospholipase family protein [Chitinophagaceae bacterium]|nr:patatin-like phospholipase family protein [Chitinophagaceae bacterium]
MPNSSNGFGLRILRFVSQLLKSLWLFFPGILFLILFIFCFWMLGQGKDIIIAFTENQSHIGFLSFNYTRIIFFLAIGFWVYVSWYSSRIISYIKKSKQEDKVQEIAGIDREEVATAFKAHKNYFELGENFLDEFPRIIGNACFLIFELAVLQSPLLYNPIGSTIAMIIFIIALILLRYLNKWITKSQAKKPSFRKAFYVLLSIFIALILFVSFLPGKAHIFILLGLIILFHAVFIFYINLRRVQMEDEADTVKAKIKLEQQKGNRRSFLIKIMDFFCVPRMESGYFKWFLFIGICGIVFYLLAINWLLFARAIGPFPFMILAFGVLLAFGNIVTAFSVRHHINFHFLFFVLALLFGLGETHYVRKFHPAGDNNNYANRPQLQTYLTAWLNDRNVSADSSAGGYDIYFVMANGGASRSGYWTASVLGKIEDSTIQFNRQNRFSDHVFCLSGTSGGGVGVASFFGLLKDKNQKEKAIYSLSSKEFLKQDYFTYTVARMLGPDFFNYIFHVSAVADRAAALESSFEESSLKNNDSTYRVPFYDTLSQFPALKNGKVYLPILCINTTRMQDGNPGVVTNLKLDSDIFNNRVDVLKLLKKNEDITLTSGAILGARFPYLSPAGRIANNYFVDGGYFDNSGAGVVQEMIRGILNIAKEDSLHNGTLYKQIRRLHFKILHITNSPVNLDSSNIKRVAPFKNDLLAPILTIVGAYDMQTTVNDGRLINYIKDINNYSRNKADYIQIPLYKDSIEWKLDPLRERFKDKEPPYAMNWFMSDTTIRRIDKRLHENQKLDSLIMSMHRRADTIPSL